MGQRSGRLSGCRRNPFEGIRASQEPVARAIRNFWSALSVVGLEDDARPDGEPVVAQPARRSVDTAEEAHVTQGTGVLLHYLVVVSSFAIL